MMILGLLGRYFDAMVVFVTKSSLLFKLAVAILCSGLAYSPLNSAKLSCSSEVVLLRLFSFPLTQICRL